MGQSLKEIMAAKKAAAAVPHTLQASVPPSLQSSVPQVRPTAIPQTAVPQTAVPQVPLNGGSNLASIREQLRTTSVNTRREDIPFGSGIYLLKTGSMKTTRDKDNLLSFQFICLRAIKDGAGIAPGMPEYTGAIEGREYSCAIFQNKDYALKNNLQALSVCLGWSSEKVKQMQGTEEGLDLLTALLFSFTGSNEKGPIPDATCAFSNQVVLQMSCSVRVTDALVNKKPSYDENGKKLTKTFNNTYWDKKLPIEEIASTIDENILIKAFGSMEAIEAALAVEAELAAY